MRTTHLFLAAGEGLGSKISLFILLIYAGDGHSHWRYGGETPTPTQTQSGHPALLMPAHASLSPRIHVCQSRTTPAACPPPTPIPASFTCFPPGCLLTRPHHFFYSASLKVPDLVFKLPVHTCPLQALRNGPRGPQPALAAFNPR